MNQVLSVYAVFTPTTQATINFVQRKAVNDQLVDALRTPGKQLIVYGESGCGKSTLLLKKLHELYSGHITSQCSAAMTYEQLLLNAFDQLDEYYIEGATRSAGREVKGSLVVDFSRIRASIDAASRHDEAREATRILPPQLTPQRLAQFLGAHGLCWVIEDFHKMEATEKLPLAQSFKVFSDVSATYPEVKIVAIGATDTAREVVEYDPEMTNRVSELLVPLMVDEELREIVRNGQRLLNIDLSELADDIVQYSMGVPAVCHQLALNVCLEAGIVATGDHTLSLGRDAMKAAVERWIRESSDTLKAKFDRALRRRKVRKYDNCRLILSVLAAGPLHGMLHSEVLEELKRQFPDYPPANLTLYLRELMTEERGSVLRSGLDRRFRFVDPLHHTFAQVTLLEPSERHSAEPITVYLRGAWDSYFKDFPVTIIDSGSFATQFRPVTGTFYGGGSTMTPRNPKKQDERDERDEH